MDDRALDHALEARRRLRILVALGHEVRELVVDVVGEVVAQHVEIDGAGIHDGGRVAVVDQREEQVLQRRVFLVALVGEGERAVKRLFEAIGE